jgi:hypothetical protein
MIFRSENTDEKRVSNQERKPDGEGVLKPVAVSNNVILRILFKECVSRTRFPDETVQGNGTVRLKWLDRDRVVL